jgi:hypothetical protein
MSERAIILVMMIIICALGFVLGSTLGGGKLKPQREQKTDDDTIVKYAPMPRTFFSDDIWRPISQAHFSFGMSEWVDKLIPDGSRINEDRTNMSTNND